MKNIVFKLAPYECFEVQAIEEWLDELNQKGLQFRSKWGPFCRFERSPSPTRYRVDPRRSEDGRTQEERMSTYFDLGWEFCSDYTRNAEIYRATREDAVELHTDHDLLQGLVKRSILDRVSQCLLNLILFIYTLKIGADAFPHWDAWNTNPLYISVPLITITLPLILLSSIALTLHALLRRKTGSAVSADHADHPRKWITFWRGLQLCLGIMCVIGYLLAVIYLASM